MAQLICRDKPSWILPRTLSTDRLVKNIENDRVRYWGRNCQFLVVVAQQAALSLSLSDHLGLLMLRSAAHMAQAGIVAGPSDFVHHSVRDLRAHCGAACPHTAAAPGPRKPAEKPHEAALAAAATAAGSSGSTRLRRPDDLVLLGMQPLPRPRRCWRQGCLLQRQGGRV